MIRIKIKTTNAAFCDQSHDRDDANARAVECARILRELAGRIEAFGVPTRLKSFRLIDYNGHMVGECKGGAS